MRMHERNGKHLREMQFMRTDAEHDAMTGMAYHDNLRRAYDSQTGNAYYAKARKAFDRQTGVGLHENGRKAFDIFSGDAFHPNARKAYDARSGRFYDINGRPTVRFDLRVTLGVGITLDFMPERIITIYGRPVINI